MGENITKHHPAMSTETEDHYRNNIYKGIKVSLHLVGYTFLDGILALFYLLKP